MNYNSIEKKREDVEGQLRIYSYEVFCANVFNGTISNESNLIKSSNNFIKLIKEVFENYSKEDVDKILGGEFDKLGYYETKDYFPIYLQLDVIIRFIELNYLYVLQENKNAYVNITLEDVKTLLGELRELREKCIALPYNRDVFRPDSEMTDGLITKMANAMGNYEINYIKKGEKTFPVMKVIKRHVNAGIDKSGDGYGSSVSEYVKDFIIYKNDLNEYIDINNREQREIFERENNDAISKFNKYITRYFKPDYNFSVLEMEENLLDSNLNNSFKYSLLKLIKVYNEYIKNEEEMLDRFKKQLENVEYYEKLMILERKNIEEENIKRQEEFSQEKRLFFELAKKNYNKKSFFWKLKNIKLNPEKLDIDSLNNEEFEEIKIEYKRKGL